MSSRLPVILFLLLAATPAAANNVHNENLGTDYPTIVEALEDPALARGHVLIVSPGTYEEKIVMGDPPVTLKSTFETDPGAVATTVLTNTQRYENVFRMTGGTLAGFTVADCFSQGSNAYVSGDALVSHNIFQDNGSLYASGAMTVSGRARILFNTFLRNSTCGIFGIADGGACSISGEVLFLGNIVQDNYGACDQNCYGPAPRAVEARGGGDVVGGGVRAGGPVWVVSNLFRGNCGTFGAGIAAGGSYLVNNTIVENEGDGARTYQTLVANNIFAYNTWQGLDPTESEIHRNLFFSDALGDSVTGNDPLFADPELDPDMLHLGPSSPARDAGRGDLLRKGNRDVDGGDRKVGPAVDIGADEALAAAVAERPGLPTGVNLLEGSVPGLALETPRPNPRHGRTPARLDFTLPAAGTVRFVLLDVRGRRVAERAPEAFASGAHTVVWSPGDLPSGGYFLRLSLENGGGATVPWVMVR